MIIPQMPIDITQIEAEIHNFVDQLGCELMSQVLENLDNQLMQTRDTQKYRHKGAKPTVLKTTMGEVVYSRVSYEFTDKEGRPGRVFLLDQAIGNATYGKISELLAEKIAAACCEMSFRKTAETIRSTTRQTISHGGAWCVVQKMGRQADWQERKNARLAKKNQGIGQQEVKLLFEEQDGVWLNLQGKDRKKRGSSIEMKVAIAYKGAKKTGKKRYNLDGKVACANFEDAAAFYERKEGVIAETYDVDEIEMRILNADGANWCKRSLVDDTTHYQLDTFHRNKAILTYVSNPEAQQIIRQLLYSKQIDKMFDVIEAYSNSTEDEKERENYLKLFKYFQNNREGLILYKRHLTLPEKPDDIFFRNCGAMESNIFSIIGRRMKHRRCNWSIRGGNNMARLLTLKSTGRLSEFTRNFSPMTLPERYTEVVETVLSAAKIPEKIGQGYDGFQQAQISVNLPFLKEIFKQNPLI